jgi:hypothetical protein
MMFRAHSGEMVAVGHMRRNCGGIDRDHQVVVGGNMVAYLYQFTSRHSEL